MAADEKTSQVILRVGCIERPAGVACDFGGVFPEQTTLRVAEGEAAMHLITTGHAAYVDVIVRRVYWTRPEGGTQPVGGTTDAELNVTSNYGKHFDFARLHGLRAIQTYFVLHDAVTRFGTERSADYWDPTPGNVGATCRRLLEWVVDHPTARWRVS